MTISFHRFRRAAAAALVLAAAAGAGRASAQTSAGDRAAADRHPAAPLLARYCFGCHGPRTQTAGVNLDALIAQRPLVRNREAWTRVLDALEVGKMPPAGAPRPSGAERETLHALLSDSVDGFDYSTVDDPGYEPLKRLTHRELDNTLRDLLGANFTVTDRFPAELAGASGFDNSANTLFLESTLMERYIAAAERVVELMLPAEPATAAERRAHELVFVAAPGGGLSDEEAAERVLRRFLERAWRRPPGAGDVARSVGRYRAARRSGRTFEEAVKVVLQAVLISPRFLLRIETPPASAGSGPYRVSDWDLAARLSYFLWSSMPDAELRGLARRGALRDPAVLEAQVDRMLDDPKADALGTGFAAQWLGFQHVGSRIWLDPIDNPWCTDTLMTAMRDESSLFFLSLVRGDQPIRRLIDADYTFVNEELATTLYGMEGVEGDHMRRVPLDDPNRGGYLGHGSILALTSNYKDTSPVKRGHYVLDVLLGTPPPPPPPGAGVLSEELGDLRRLSFREKLEMHSSNPACSACHRRIDPIGFSLENFDYFGRWRDAYHFRERVETEEEADEIRIVEDTNVFAQKRFYRNTYTPIAAAGSLPGGAAFDGPAGLKRTLLAERHGDLVRQTASKMLAYALGRQLEYYDEPALRKIIAALEADGHRFRTLVREIVASYPFQYKKQRQ